MEVGSGSSSKQLKVCKVRKVYKVERQKVFYEDVAAQLVKQLVEKVKQQCVDEGNCKLPTTKIEADDECVEIGRSEFSSDVGASSKMVCDLGLSESTCNESMLTATQIDRDRRSFASKIMLALKDNEVEKEIESIKHKMGKLNDENIDLKA